MRRLPWDIIILFAAISFGIAYVFYSRGCGRGGHCDPAPYTQTMSQVKVFEAAVASYKETYKRLPGDTQIVRGCNETLSNSDGIVGRPSFYKDFKPCYNSSMSSIMLKEDESIRFWQELLNADLIFGIDDGRSVDLQLGWKKTMPAARVGGGFVVGHADGKFPENLSPRNEGMRGTIVVLKSSPDDSIALDAPNKQPLSPLRAAQIDRKLDDGIPNKGFVQAYGAPSCFKIKEGGVIEDDVVDYDEANIKKDCGLIFRIQAP